MICECWADKLSLVESLLKMQAKTCRQACSHHVLLYVRERFVLYHRPEQSTACFVSFICIFLSTTRRIYYFLSRCYISTASSGNKRYPRQLQSANSRRERAHRVRINENAVRMTPPRDHNYALRRWLRSPILVIVDMSS